MYSFTSKGRYLYEYVFNHFANVFLHACKKTKYFINISLVFSENSEMTESNVFRYEAPSSTGGKFWEISRDGVNVSTKWGKLTAKGQSKSTVFEDEVKAKKFVETTIRKKEKEGYVLAKPTTTKASSAPVKTKVKKVEVLEEENSNEGGDEDSNEDEGVPTSYVLPAIYNTDSKGKERVHLSWVIKNKLTKQHGEVNGKHTLADRSFEGKNTGRVNETDANEQACREAERDWVKQINKGYKPKKTDKIGMSVYKKVIAEKANQGGVNTNTWMILAKELRGVTIAPPKVKTGAAAKTDALKEKKKADNGTLPGYKSDLFPMGCQKLVPPNRSPTDPEEKVLKYLDFENGVYIQRKLDGIRCLVRIIELDSKKYVVMTSRASNQFVHLKSLRKEVLTFLKGREDVVLDCEVYQHEIHASANYKKVGGKNKVVFTEGDEIIPRMMNFKAITSTVRSAMTNPSPLEDQMCLYVFDIVDPTENLTQDERFEILDGLFARKQASLAPKIIQVERYEIYSPEEIPEYQNMFVKEGYEGVVLRDRSLKYECLKKNKKSKWMRKYKYFFDQEWAIIGVRRDKGVPREQFTWVCALEDGTKFYPKPEGTREMKWEWFDNKDEYIGKMLIVRYQELETSGKPRFPIGIEIRDFE